MRNNKRIEMLELNEELIDQMEIQIFKRIEEDKTTTEILEEMRDSFAEMFMEEKGLEEYEAKLAGKELTLDVMNAIGKRRGVK